MSNQSTRHKGQHGWHLGLDSECPECSGSTGPSAPPRSQFDPLAARFGPRPAENPNAPDPQDLLRELHRAVYGDTWARPEPPEKVWRELIQTVEAWRTWPCRTQGPAQVRNDALADAASLARFIQGRGVIKPGDEHEAVIIGHRLGCASIAEHIEMMRRGPRLHDDSCPACKWIEEQLETKTHTGGSTP